MKNNQTLERFLQTNAANSIKKDYVDITKQLLLFKEKLDLRNPKAYDKTLSPKLYSQIDNLTDEITLPFFNTPVNNYKEYLQIAFSKTNIQNRNDFLILGLYKHIYDAYDIAKGHQLTAFSYDEHKLQTLYQNLQILKWKITTNKDIDENYLFLTWQNNWQIELQKRLKNGENITFEDLQELKFIQEGKETLFSKSNSSFEILLTNMTNRVKSSLETLGVEPVDVGLDALKTMFIFL
jgi:hypothetical protein